MNLPPLPEAERKELALPHTRDSYTKHWYSADQLRQAQREAVAAYKAELFQKYESSTERATEAEGDAFTHGYLCGEREAIVPESIKAAIKHAAAVLESEAGPLTREATAKGIRDTLREVLAASPEVKS